MAQPDGLTDLGNAQRLARRYGDDLHYVHLWHRWLVWDGARWAADETGQVMRLAKDTVKALYREASEIEEGGARKALASHARRSESEPRIRAMIMLAQSEPGIPLRHEELDTDPWLLNTPKGTIDLQTGELQPHARDQKISKLAPVEYREDAQSELWEQCLERWLPDPATRDFVQRAAGYSLTGWTDEQVLFIPHGSGANGKTTFLETLRAALGDYAMAAPADTLLRKRDGGIPNDVARLRGARFVSAVETEEGRRLAEARVKQLTGGDMVSARFMRGEFFEFKPIAKIWLGTNHRPVIRGTDSAIWRRIRLIPFTVAIPDEEKDPRLLEKLQAESPGVLSWAVQGCLEWQRIGLEPPPEVLVANEEYRQEQDVLGDFFEERCVFGDANWVLTAKLYEEYTAWTDTGGEKPLTKKMFGLRLQERGFVSARHGGGARIWKGLGVRSCDV